MQTAKLQKHKKQIRINILMKSLQFTVSNWFLLLPLLFISAKLLMKTSNARRHLIFIHTLYKK